MKIRQILYGMMLLVAATACENDAFVWGNEDFVRLNGPESWTLGTDSMAFSFAVYPTEMKEFTVNAELVVEGNVSGKDRVVRLRVDTARSTAVATDYQFSTEVTLPAEAHSVMLPIVLRRTELMKQQSVRLRVEIAPDSELAAGVNSAAGLTISWNDILSQPTNWGQLEEFFGAYSETKYRFIISTLGIAVFPYGEGEFTWGKMWNYRQEMVTALEEWNNNPENNAPMKDEYGNPVSF